jgi:hypothetical protein
MIIFEPVQTAVCRNLGDGAPSAGSDLHSIGLAGPPPAAPLEAALAVASPPSPPQPTKSGSESSIGAIRAITFMSVSSIQ